MTRLESILRKILTDLEDEGVRFAVVGALAVSERAEPRFTRDVDLAVAVGSDPQAEALTKSLLGRGYEVHAKVEHEAVGRLATVRLSTSGARGPVVDLLFASSGIETEIIAAAERLQVLPDLVAPVATLEHLLALKVLSVDQRRMQDHMDILVLLREATALQIDATRAVLSLITERGYDRGQDLQDKLNGFLELQREEGQTPE